MPPVAALLVIIALILCLLSFVPSWERSLSPRGLGAPIGYRAVDGSLEVKWKSPSVGRM